ncbi:MAG: phytanoyl-CoA dioxygenase [Methylococcaceae bacterium]|nr:MAG: phytanoyl-CoA dioxygenase [Methylococcaceae bacterium]
MSIKKLLLLPFYLLTVFTWSKSFRNNPVIGNYTLNLLGLHVFRVVLSHLLFNFRLCLLSPLVSHADRDSYRRNGFILKENFLAPDEFQALKSELLNYRGPIREIQEGNTLTQRVFLTRERLSHLPMCLRFTENPALLKPVRYASSKNRIPFFHIENLKHGVLGHNGDDPQKHMHTDTFHPCMKAWLFIDEVTRQNGPFTYVPGSHKLTWQRIQWEYAQSLAACRNKNAHDSQRYWDGSFRVSSDELREFGYPEPKAMIVPANTLLIGNVHGFHRRGDAEANTSRMTLWMQARDNPFNPLFTPFPRLSAGAFEYVWSIYLRKRDVKMQGEGKLATVESTFDAKPEPPPK